MKSEMTALFLITKKKVYEESRFEEYTISRSKKDHSLPIYFYDSFIKN